MSTPQDAVQAYAAAIGLEIKQRTMLVEGTSDVRLFKTAARLHRSLSGIDLFDGFAITAAGEGDLGGTRGVVRELHCLRGLVRACLLPSGKPRYRFSALFDSDKAGHAAIRAAKELDPGMVEFKDLFLLRPAMPFPGMLDPGTVASTYAAANSQFRSIDWELEDLLPNSFFDELVVRVPSAIVREAVSGGRVHRDLSRDGKAKLHRLVDEYASAEDLKQVIEVLSVLRYLGGAPRL